MDNETVKTSSNFVGIIWNIMRNTDNKQSANR